MVKRITEFQKAAIKTLRKHGVTYEEIAKALQIGMTSSHTYGTGVNVLPKPLRLDPWDEVRKLKDAPAIRSPESGELTKAMKEKEYWAQNHVEGERLDSVAIGLFSLDELSELMREPTNYQSPLCQTDWYNYYMAPQAFRGVSTELCNTQIMLNHFFDTNLHALAAVPRKMGKTVLAEGRLTRFINENRENNYAVQSENVERSMERLMVVRNHLMGNPRLIADYGYLPLDRDYKKIRGAWKNNQITVKRDTIQTDPTLKAVSWKDARLLGGHFHGILFDDPWSSKLEENNEKNKEKWFRWYDSTLIGCMEDNSWQHIICTFKGLYDVYRDLIDRGVFNVYRQPAIFDYPSDYEYIKNEAGKIIDVIVKSKDWHISDDGNGRFSVEEDSLIGMM